MEYRKSQISGNDIFYIFTWINNNLKWVNNNLKWANHVKNLASSCYSVLSTLRKLKNLASFHIKKQLAESLVLSKMDYNIVVCHLLPAYQMKKLQRVQNTAARFVTNRYCNESDVLSLGWLPVKERIEFNLMRLAHKCRQLCTHCRQLRSDDTLRLKIPLETGTFQDCCAKMFNELPVFIRNDNNIRSFLKSLKTLLASKAREKLLSKFLIVQIYFLTYIPIPIHLFNIHTYKSIFSNIYIST